MDNWKQDWARLRGYTASSRTHSTEVKKILERSPPFDLFIDCGPGKVLCGLIKSIEDSFELFSVYDQTSLENSLLKVFSIFNSS